MRLPVLLRPEEKESYRRAEDRSAVDYGSALEFHVVGRSRHSCLSDRGWRALAVNGLLFLAMLNGALALHAYREIGSLRADVERSLSRTEQRYQSLDAQVSFASDRRRLLLGIRDDILKTRPELGVSGAYQIASLVLDASDKFPSVDPLLLVSVGMVESGFDSAAISRTGARGLYQLHSSTGRLLARALGWEYSDELLHDAAKNTEMAACYFDLLQTVHSDVAMVLAEYNGGPLDAGYLRAGVGPVSTETKDYVPRVLDVYQRLLGEHGAQRGARHTPILSAAESNDGLSLVATPAASAAVAK